MHDMLNDMEFEERLNELGENQPALIRFLAHQQFSTSKVLLKHDKRIGRIEKQNKKIFGLAGGAGAILGTAITATIDYLLRRS